MVLAVGISAVLQSFLLLLSMVGLKLPQRALASFPNLLASWTTNKDKAKRTSHPRSNQLDSPDLQPYLLAHELNGYQEKQWDILSEEISQ